MTRRFWTFALAAILAALGAVPALGHEVRPAYLEITEQSVGAASSSYQVLWKQPLLEGRRLSLDPQFGPDCEAGERKAQRVQGTALTQGWTVTCSAPLERIEIVGLDRTLTDVFVRMDLGGETHTALLRPDARTFEIGAAQETPASLGYLWLGIEHIAFGFDHLLFVAGLLLLLGGKRIIVAVTAFTVAHSITLALATLGGISLPGTPVEIMIAASIVLVAYEALLIRKGRKTLVTTHPWPVIFAIGLVHGLGFAGALAEVGLPADQQFSALLLFNLGIELGQLAFVAALAGLLYGAGRLWSAKRVATIETLVIYGIGTAGMFWLIDRLIG